MWSLQKSDRKISHPNDLQPAVKDITVNSLYSIVSVTTGWRWFEYLKCCISSNQIFFGVALCCLISTIRHPYSLSGWVLSQIFRKIRIIEIFCFLVSLGHKMWSDICNDEKLTQSVFIFT